MRLRVKAIILFTIVLSLYLFVARVAESIKERYIYRFIVHRIQEHFEKNWNATLYIEKISGNILTNIKLRNLSLVASKEYPGDLQFRAKAVNIRYKPFDILLARKFNAEFVAPHI